MSYRLEFNIFQLPPSPNKISKTHWSSEANVRVEWRQRTKKALGFEKMPLAPLKRAKVTCTRYAPRPLDRDNLGMSFKPIVDQLVTSGVLEDDSERVLVGPFYLNEKASIKQSRITVVVEEIE